MSGFEDPISEFTDNHYTGLCHICRRELDCHDPREVIVLERIEGATGRDAFKTSESKGIGWCPEHSVSYDHKSMDDVKCDTCSCDKDDCPVCTIIDDEHLT